MRLLVSLSVFACQPGLFHSLKPALAEEQTPLQRYLAMFDPLPEQVSTPSIKLKGQVLPGSQVTLNEAPIPVNAEGYFEQEIPLQIGQNTLQVLVTHGERSRSKTFVVQRVAAKPSHLELTLEPFSLQQNSDSLIITGKTSPGATVSTGNQQVSSDAEGRFKLPVALVLGLNRIQLTVSTAEQTRVKMLEVTRLAAPPTILPLQLGKLPAVSLQANVHIIGKTQPGAQISDGTQHVSSNTKGYFTLPVSLQPGTNHIKLTVSTAEQTRVKMLEIAYKVVSMPTELPLQLSELPTETTQTAIEITGKTLPGVTVQIGDQQATSDAQGQFSVPVKLQQGNNNIRLEVSHGDVSRMKFLSITSQPLQTAAIVAHTKKETGMTMNPLQRLRLPVSLSTVPTETAAEQLNIQGTTSPHALVRVGTQQTEANAQGHFTLAVNLEPGSNALALEVSRGDKVWQRTLQVNRLVPNVPTENPVEEKTKPAIMNSPRLLVSFQDVPLRTPDNQITIIGETKAGIEIKSGNQKTTSDENGHFELKVTLHKGLNQIRVEVSDAEISRIKTFEVEALGSGALDIQATLPSSRLPLTLNEVPAQTKDPWVWIGGQTAPKAKVYGGIKTVVADDKGMFRVKFPLQNGSNLVRLAVEKDNLTRVKTLEINSNQPPDWFAVGLADLEMGQFSLGGNLQAIEQNDNFPKTFYVDGRVAFYVKGKIQGKYLLTSSFDSSRQFQGRAQAAIDPNRFYPIYGDSSTLLRDAQSSGKLYVRLEMVAPDKEDPEAEQNRSNILLGDYNAGLVSEGSSLGQYNRTFYGLRSHLETSFLPEDKPAVAVTLFGAPVRTIPVRDEMRATGLSHYKLSVTQTRFLQEQSVTAPTANQNAEQLRQRTLNQLAQPFIVEGSEIVTVLIRDKNQPDRILNTKVLQRDVDYQVDPFFGSLTIKTPIMTFDPNGNLQFVVVNYEYTNDPFYGLNPLASSSLGRFWEQFKNGFDATLQHNAFGGRIETNVFNKTLSLGTNYVQENQAPQNSKLFSADAVWTPAEGYKLIGEYAFSFGEASQNPAGGGGLLNPLNGYLSYDGGLNWNAVSISNNLKQTSGHAFRVEMEATPFDWTRMRLFLRQTDPFFGSLFGGGEPGVRRWGSNIEQQLSDHFSLLGDLIWTDNLPRPDATFAGGTNALASVGVHWQNTPISREQKLPNAPGGDISLRQQQSIIPNAVQDKLAITGGAPAQNQPTAKELTSPPLAQGVTEKVANPTDPNQPVPNTAAGNMFGDARLEYNRSDNTANSIQTGRLRLSFNYAPLDQLLGNIRTSLGYNHIYDAKDTKNAQGRGEVSGELGIGATYSLDKYLAVFSRVDAFNLGSTVFQPSTTASVGLMGSLVDNETISTRPYAQYGLNSAINGRNNIIALGLNNRWKINDWLTNNLNFEQSFNINDTFKGVGNSLSTATAGSLGFEILPKEINFRSSAKYELRRQAGTVAPTINPVTNQSSNTVPGLPGTSVVMDPTLSPQLNPGANPGMALDNELWQHTGTLAMNGKLGDASLFGQYFFSQFNTPEILRSRELTLRTGVAFRPVNNDIFNIIGMHEYRNISQPNPASITAIDIPIELQADAHVLSVEGIWQILANLEFSQKYAVKFSNSTVLDTSIRNPAERSINKTIRNPEPVVTDLIISRLSYRPLYNLEFWERFDVAGEYRVMRQWPDSIFNAKNGFLTEVGFLMTPDLRLGAGYNFVGFDDFSTRQNNYTAGNWFLRVTGKY